MSPFWRGARIVPGQAIADFRGETWTFVHVTGGPVSTGKIIVTGSDGQRQREFFASVFPGLSVADTRPDEGDAG